MICIPHRPFLLGRDAVSARVSADDSKYRSAAIFKVIQSFKQECFDLKFKVQLLCAITLRIFVVPTCSVW